MTDQNMILILVIAFFLLGCSFSCNGMKENFTDIEAECKKICDENNGTTSDYVMSCFTCAQKYSDDAAAEACLACKENIDKHHFNPNWQQRQLEVYEKKGKC